MAENFSIVCAGVIGVGTMGSGIAQVLAQGGIEVRLFDQRPEAVAKAISSIQAQWHRDLEKGRMTAEAVEAATHRLHGITDLSELAGSQIVVEAIVEKLEAKQGLFTQLERILAQNAVLATNTSSLSVTAIQSACERPERVVGWHFFNPVPRMKIAEVVRGELTDPQVADSLCDFTAALGHQPVQATDMPGFVVNHVGRAYIPEGIRLLSEGIADSATIDSIMKDVCRFPMGPFELLDLIGLDVAKSVMESLYHQYYEEPRFKIHPLLSRRVAAGMLGRKSGKGFYSYRDGIKLASEEGQVLEVERPSQASPVWIDRSHPDLAEKVEHMLQTAGVDVEKTPVPSPDALILLTPVGEDTTTSALRTGLDARRCVAVNALFEMGKRLEIMGAPALDPEFKNVAFAILARTGKAISYVADSPGFVSQRIVAQIVSIGCDIAQQGIASVEDIDLAARLGLGYPMGPFSFGDALGPARVLQILEALEDAYGDPRYRPSIWLKRRARLGLPLTH